MTADYCFCFVRTDPEASKHAGISVLIIDMKTPGIQTRPIAELTDSEHADFNEVFFTDVEVPAENLVGELHHGWSVAGGSLAHERGMLWINEATGTEKILERVVTTATTPLPGGRRLADDPAFRTTVARAYMQTQALKLLGYRGFAKFAKGAKPSEHSVLKLLGSELRRGLALDVGEALGATGLDLSRHEAPSVGRRRQRGLVGALAAELRGHHRRRDVGDPAQHHRRARARPAAQVAPTPRARPAATSRATPRATQGGTMPSYGPEVLGPPPRDPAQKYWDPEVQTMDPEQAAGAAERAPGPCSCARSSTSPSRCSRTS